MFAKKIGLDLGTSFCRICSPGMKEFYTERNILIVNNQSEKVVYKGSKAFEIFGKESSDLKVIKPIKNGILQEPLYQKELLNEIVVSLAGRNPLIRPEFVVSIPNNLRESDKNSVATLLDELGAKPNVTLIPEIILSAVGLGLPIQKSTGTAIVNLGAGTVETAVMSLGGIVVGESLSYGGEDLDSLIIDQFRLSNIEIGRKTAEKLKIQYGTAEIISNSEFSEVKGKDINNGKIVNYTFKIDLIRQAMLSGIEKIAESIRNVLEKLPPELASDIIDNGLVITGGVSNLKNLNFYLSNYLNVPVYRLDNSYNSCILGLDYIIKNPDILGKEVNIK